MQRPIASAVLAVMLGVSAGMIGQQNDPETQKVMDEYRAAWGKADAKGLAALHTTDAIRIGSDGQLSSGRDAIEKSFAKNFAGTFKGTKLTLELGRTQNVTSDVRVTEGTYEVTGGSGGPLKGRFLNTFVRQQGQWRLASVAAIPQSTGK
jgi:uncharacterized protein (TIGR02246 family)